jgi:hypothetical protein
MSVPHAHHEFEPFGQRGIRGMVRPLFIGFCAMGVAISLAMLVRSHKYYDRVSQSRDYRRTDLTSAMGQIVYTNRRTLRPAPGGTGWQYESAEFTSDNDGWPESWKKVIGVQWGDESFTRADGRVFQAWRLRIRWRTLLAIYAIPVLLDAFSKYRRNRRPHGFEVAPSPK